MEENMLLAHRQPVISIDNGAAMTDTHTANHLIHKSQLCSLVTNNKLLSMEFSKNSPTPPQLTQ